MRCYKLHKDFDCGVSLSYSLNTSREDIVPRPPGTWFHLKDMDFTPGWRFSEKTRAEVAKMTMLINPAIPQLPDVIGDFSIILTSPPAFCAALKQAVEGFDPDLCDFLEVDPFWSKSEQREYPGLGYCLTSIRKRIDAWDREKCKVVEMTRRNGTTWFTTSGKRVARASALEGAVLWRDAYTNDPLCTDTFKDLAEAAGCAGMGFYEIEVSDS